jgi:hypothetical protein
VLPHLDDRTASNGVLQSTLTLLVCTQVAHRHVPMCFHVCYHHFLCQSVSNGLLHWVWSADNLYLVHDHGKLIKTYPVSGIKLLRDCQGKWITYHDLNFTQITEVQYVIYINYASALQIQTNPTTTHGMQIRHRLGSCSRTRESRLQSSAV